MKQQPWKRALSLMLAFALMFAMPCVTGVYAAGEPVDYIERWWDSRKQVVDSHADSVTVYTEIDPNTTTWNGGTTGGWYVVSGNVEITSRVTVTGDVHLILMDGSTLTVNGGIQVKDDDDNPDTPSADSLTIYGQEKGSGTVKAIGGLGLPASAATVTRAKVAQGSAAVKATVRFPRRRQTIHPAGR